MAPSEHEGHEHYMNIYRNQFLVHGVNIEDIISMPGVTTWIPALCSAECEAFLQPKETSSTLTRAVD